MIDLFGALNDVAKRYPSSIASFSSAGYLSHRSFMRNVESAARHALSQGLRPGQLVVVKTNHQDARLQLILGLMRIGCRVGVSQNIDNYLRHDLVVDAVVTDDPKATGARRRFVLGPEWFKPNPYVALPDKGGFSLLFNSSGSTGAGKIMEIQDQGFVYRLQNRFNELHHGERPRFLCCIGEGMSNSLQDCIVVLLKGGMIFRPLDRSPAGVLDAMQLHRPNYVFTTPSMIAAWLKILDEQPAKIERVGVLRVGGAYFSPEMRAAALKHFGESLVMSFGSTETGNIAAMTFTDPNQTNSIAGRVRDDVEIKTVDGEGNDLPPGVEGDLRIRVPAGVVATYPGKNLSTNPTFQDGWFITGDIGQIDSDRNLRISGRAGLLINNGGVMVNPEAMEAAASQYAGLQDIGVVGLDGPNGFQEVHAGIVSSAPIDLFRLNQYLKAQHVHFGLDAIHNVAQIPLTEAGKVDRPALRALLKASAKPSSR